MRQAKWRGDRAKALREGLGLSSTKVGGEVGVTARTVTNWEAGDSVPDAEQVGKLSSLLGCTVNYLLGLTGEPEVAFEAKAAR